jgi:hypothetical protein
MKKKRKKEVKNTSVYLAEKYFKSKDQLVPVDLVVTHVERRKGFHGNENLAEHIRAEPRCVSHDEVERHDPSRGNRNEVGQVHKYTMSRVSVADGASRLLYLEIPQAKRTLVDGTHTRHKHTLICAGMEDSQDTNKLARTQRLGNGKKQRKETCYISFWKTKIYCCKIQG